MSRKITAAKWVLPTVIDPADRLCVQIKIPNERMHRAAFFGALQILGSASFWADDPLHKAREVALVWRDVIDKITFCIQSINIEDHMPHYRQVGCVLEVECVNGEWAVLYDPTDCIQELIRAASGQEEPAGDITPGETVEECDIVMLANGRYIFPYKVSPGDTVTVTQASGGVYGRPGQFHWFCPSGQDYVFGLCTGSGDDVAGVGFPMPGELAMRLIAEYSGVFYDAFNTTFVIPTGVPVGDLQFQVNDTDLSDNAGSVTFCVAVSHPVDTSQNFEEYDWVVTLDLAGVDWSWAVSNNVANGNEPNDYVQGVGMQSGLSGNQVNARFSLHIAGGAGEVRAVVAECYSGAGDPVGSEGYWLQASDLTGANNYYDYRIFTEDVWTSCRVDIPASEIQLDSTSDVDLTSTLTAGVGTGSNAIIRKIIVAGNGAVPTVVPF